MLFHCLLPDILYFFILKPQYIVPIKAKLSREIFYFLGDFFMVVWQWALTPLLKAGVMGKDLCVIRPSGGIA
jgi:hypothetical protein